MATLPNIWHLRRVADTAARACLVCHKPSSSVLITPNNKDYFYVCLVHLKDRHFCSPIVDAEEETAKKRAEAMAREIEKVKKEYEEKKQRKKEKEKEKAKEKKKGDPKDDKGNDKDDSSKKADDKKEEKERDDKIDAIKKQSTSTLDDSPRIFALHKNFYQMRVDRMRNLEAAKRNRQRLQDPSFFPSVPSGGL
ncbi:VPS4-associated protein 1 [Aspergillus navahoensis]